MADDANQALEGLPFFLAQRLAQIRQHQQLVRTSALPELAAADLPASDAARKRGVDDPRRLALETLVEADLVGAPAEQALRRLRRAAARRRG